MRALRTYGRGSRMLRDRVLAPTSSAFTRLQSNTFAETLQLTSPGEGGHLINDN